MRVFEARAWLVWLLAGGLLAIMVSNPLYLVLLLLLSRVVEFACAPVGSRGWRLPFWRIAAVILLFSTLFNMLTAHIGQTVLLELPAAWPLIGGALNLEAAVFGFVNGLRLITLLSFFLAFNTIVPVSELTNLAPRALHELGLVMLIAVTYIPETLRQFRRIRDAQAIRGHELRGLRTLRPLVVPLLVGGLERALNLAETMVARGYGATSPVAIPAGPRLLMLGGLLFALGGALRLAWGGEDGWLLLGAAAAVIAWAYHLLSGLSPRTHYRPRRWSTADTLVVFGALVACLPLLPTWRPVRQSLFFNPYPQLMWPLFNVGWGLLLFGLATPAILMLAGGAEVEVSR